MNELQLVGYTADLQHLVLSDAEGASRFKVLLDGDFVATVGEVVGLADPDSELLASLQPDPEPAPPPPPPDPPEPPEPAGPTPGLGALAAFAVLQHRAASSENGADAEAPRTSRLSPREIQSLLRAGRSPKAVAQQADVDEAWVHRWLAPIEAEREQVLMAVRQSRVSKPRLGSSRDLLGEAVQRNLTRKGVDPQDPSIRWTARRRDADDAWTVELRYRNRGRMQRAVWSFEPDTGAVHPRNRLATDIAWTRPRADRSGGTPGSTSSTSSGKTRATKKSGKRSSARKSAVSKPARRDDMAKKASARKSTAKSTGKKATAQRPAAKKTAKKTTGKTAARKAATRSTAKKAGGKKTTAKKATGKKATTRKSTAKKSTAKKSTAKRSPAKKTTARKTARKR